MLPWQQDNPGPPGVKQSLAADPTHTGGIRPGPESLCKVGQKKQASDEMPF